MATRASDPQAVRRLEADVQMLQAQIAGMEGALVAFGHQMQQLTTLTVRLSEHVNALAARLAETRL